jgi:hypothetical protein
MNIILRERRIILACGARNASAARAAVPSATTTTYIANTAATRSSIAERGVCATLGTIHKTNRRPRDVRIEHRASRLLPDQQEKEQEHQPDYAHSDKRLQVILPSLP